MNDLILVAIFQYMFFHSIILWFFDGIYFWALRFQNFSFPAPIFQDCLINSFLPTC